jgi:predicted MPP superfamily phosphohydrolase
MTEGSGPRVSGPAQRYPLSLTRRHFLTGLGASLTAAAYARYFEPHWLEVTHTVIPFFPTSPARAVRVLHLSDLHLSSVVPLSLIERAFELGLEQKPDLAVLTGDFITGRSIPEPDAYSRTLQQLSRRVACLACLGNHDGGINTHDPTSRAEHRHVRQFLQASGIPVLFNETLTWVHGQTPIQITGLGDLWSGQCHPDAAFPADDPGWPRLVLNHNPDAKDLLRAHRWNVMLCGHSHGGQLRIPFLGSPLAPLRDKRFASGLHSWEGRWIYTTRGVGNLLGVRILCRPEVSIIDLT